MRERYLTHVTLTTGHSRRSYRHEVSEQALAVCAGLLDGALSGGEPRIPAIEPPLTLTATRRGCCLAATAWAADEQHGRVPVVTIGVAGHSRCGAALWRLLHAHAHPAIPLRTVAGQCPAEPWCAARLDAPGIILYSDVADMWYALGDLERCLAWAWLERRGKPTAHAEPSDIVR
jgi:hypothetical protein